MTTPIYAQGDKVRITMISETDYGVTQTISADNLASQIPTTEWNVNFTDAEFKDAAQRADRQQHYVQFGNRSVTGDFSGSLDSKNFAPMFAGLLQNDWVTVDNVSTLIVGSTLKSFTFEDSETDIGVHALSTGAVFDKTTLNFSIGDVVNFKTTVVGRQTVVSATSISAGFAPTPPIEATPFITQTATFSEDTVVTGLISDLSIDYDNGTSTTYSLGDALNKLPTFSTIEGTGSAKIHFGNSTYYDKFTNRTPFALKILLVDPDDGETWEFLYPHCVYNGVSKTSNNSGIIDLTMPFRYLKDPVTGTSIKITRTTA